MKIVAIVPIVLFGLVAGKSENKPIISANRIYDIFADSASLVADGFRFASQKTEAALSREMRAKYTAVLAQCASGVNVLVEAPPTRAIAQWALTGKQIVQSKWAEMERRFNPVLDEWVLEFESRYPTSKWLIGGKLIDRVLLVLWLAFLVIWSTKFVCCRRRKHAVTRK